MLSSLEAAFSTAELPQGGVQPGVQAKSVSPPSSCLYFFSPVFETQSK